MTSLPTGIVAGNSGHISHHNTVHALLNPVDAPFEVAPVLVESFYADRPAAGQAGRLFGAVDTGAFEFDDGATWRGTVRTFSGDFDDRATVVPDPQSGDWYVALDSLRVYFWSGTRWAATDEAWGINVLDYGAKGDAATDDSAAFIAANAVATLSNTCVLVPSPTGDRYIIDDDIGLTGFAHWKGTGSKQRSFDNIVQSERTPSVPIEFINDHKFVSTNFDENSSLTLEHLRVFGTNTVLSVRDAFLVQLLGCSFELSAAPALAGTPAAILDNCINVKADLTMFGYSGGYDYKSLHVLNSGSPGNNLASGTHTYTNCQFNSGGIWWEYVTGVGQNSVNVTMINCIGQGMTQGLLRLISAAAGCTWSGVTMLGNSISDSASPSTIGLVDVGDDCILQDFIISGANYTPSLRVRNGGKAQAGYISSKSSGISPGFVPQFIVDAGGVMLSVEVLSEGGRRVYGGTRGYGSGTGVATATDHAGTGSPEGVVTAVVGSTYRRTDGGAGTSFYVKESGAGNTGWVAK